MIISKGETDRVASRQSLVLVSAAVFFAVSALSAAGVEAFVAFLFFDLPRVPRFLPPPGALAGLADFLGVVEALAVEACFFGAGF